MMMAVPGATWSRKLTELLEYPVVERPVWELLCVGSVIAGVVVCLLGRPDVAVVPLTVIIVVALGMLAHGDRLWTALRPGWAGTALLIVIGTETIGVFASTYRHNSIQFVISLYLLSVMYFLARNTCHRVEYRRFYHMAMSLLGTALAVVFVWNALTRTPDLRSIGLENLARFKNLIPPVAGGAVAETVTILLSLLPFTIVLLWISGDLKLLWAASAVTSVVAILLTLSRGGYIALVAFVVISTAYFVCQSRSATATPAGFAYSRRSAVGLYHDHQLDTRRGGRSADLPDRRLGFARSQHRRAVPPLGKSRRDDQISSALWSRGLQFRAGECGIQ